MISFVDWFLRGKNFECSTLGHVGNNYFKHDCAPSTFTQNGAPVFDSNANLVGICYRNLGACCAHDVDEITKDLLKLDEAQGPKSPKVQILFLVIYVIYSSLTPYLLSVIIVILSVLLFICRTFGSLWRE